MRSLLPLPLALMVALPFFAFVVCNCNEEQVKPAPDASPGCAAPTAISPCVALDAGVVGCTGSLGSEAVLGQNVTVDASYPPGCQIIVNSPTPDQDNQCTQLGTCQCFNDAGPYVWACVN